MLINKNTVYKSELCYCIDGPTTRKWEYRHRPHRRLDSFGAGRDGQSDMQLTRDLFATAKFLLNIMS